MTPRSQKSPSEESSDFPLELETYIFGNNDFDIFENKPQMTPGVNVVSADNPSKASCTVSVPKQNSKIEKSVPKLPLIAEEDSFQVDFENAESKFNSSKHQFRQSTTAGGLVSSNCFFEAKNSMENSIQHEELHFKASDNKLIIGNHKMSEFFDLITIEKLPNEKNTEKSVVKSNKNFGLSKIVGKKNNDQFFTKVNKKEIHFRELKFKKSKFALKIFEETSSKQITTVNSRTINKRKNDKVIDLKSFINKRNQKLEAVLIFKNVQSSTFKNPFQKNKNKVAKTKLIEEKIPENQKQNRVCRNAIANIQSELKLKIYNEASFGKMGNHSKNEPIKKNSGQKYSKTFKSSLYPRFNSSSKSIEKTNKEEKWFPDVSNKSKTIQHQSKLSDEFLACCTTNSKLKLFEKEIKSDNRKELKVNFEKQTILIPIHPKDHNSNMSVHPHSQIESSQNLKKNTKSFKKSNKENTKHQIFSKSHKKWEVTSFSNKGRNGSPLYMSFVQPNERFTSENLIENNFCFSNKKAGTPEFLMASIFNVAKKTKETEFGEINFRDQWSKSPTCVKQKMEFGFFASDFFVRKRIKEFHSPFIGRNNL